MRKVLVTGSEGEVGSVLLPQLAKRFDAVGFDLRPHAGAMRAVQGDLTNYADVAPALEGVEAVVHMAALLPLNRPPGDFVDLNVKATATLLQAAVDRGVRRFVYCSSVWASGQGHTEPYQPTLDDTLFGPYQVVSVRVNFSGADSLTLEQISACTDGRGLKPGARVEVALAGYVCGAGLKFRKGGESKEASLNIALDDLLLLRLDPVYEDEADPEPEDEEDREWSDD